MSRFKAEVASTRARMLQVSALLAAIVQNHPGHDQKSHAGKRDSVEVARERQAAIDTAKNFGTASSKLDELANNEVSAKTIRHFADTFEREGSLTSAQADRVRSAAESDDNYNVMRSVSDEVASSSGLTPIGRAGERVQFNPRAHQLIDGGSHPSGQVEIVRRGHDFSYGDESIRIARAVVEPVGE
jgi:hypothetical protein